MPGTLELHSKVHHPVSRDKLRGLQITAGPSASLYVIFSLFSLPRIFGLTSPAQNRLIGLCLPKQLALDICQDRDSTASMPLTVCAVCHRQANRKTAMLRADNSAIKHLLVQRIPAANAESLLTDGTLSEPRFSAVHHLFPRREYTGLISRLSGIFQYAEERFTLLWLLVFRRRRQRSRLDPAGDQCSIHSIIKRIVEGKHRWKLTI